MNTSILIGVGSNLGNRRENILQAVDLLESADIRVGRRSSLWETQSVGPSPQPDFLNAVLEVSSGLNPEALLKETQRIENLQGRRREFPSQPRPIDLDILYHGHWIIRAHSLAVPHPRIPLRRFVLVPLAELVPDFVDPIQLLTVQQMLERCPDTSWMRRLGPLQ